MVRWEGRFDLCLPEQSWALDNSFLLRVRAMLFIGSWFLALVCAFGLGWIEFGVWFEFGGLQCMHPAIGSSVDEMRSRVEAFSFFVAKSEALCGVLDFFVAVSGRLEHLAVTGAARRPVAMSLFRR